MRRIFAGVTGRVVSVITGAALCLLVSAPGAVAQEAVSSKSRAALFASQTSILDSRAASQYANSVRLKPEPVIVPSVTGVPRYNGKYRGPYLALARQAARDNGIPEDLFLRLIQQESGWNAKAKSNKGAYGLAQLMPDTAKYLAVNSKDPHQNLRGGARYLKEQYRKFGSWRLALAAYNAGPGAVEKHGGIPPFRETRRYVRIIMGS